MAVADHEAGGAAAGSPWPSALSIEPSVRHHGLFVVALFALVAIAYQPAWNGGFVWDDAAHVTHPALQSWRGLWAIWAVPGATQQYYPLTHSVFWLEHRLWGDAPLGYHLVNISLHVAASCMVAVILRRVRGAGASLAAAAFLLPPLQRGAGAWGSAT